MSQVKVVELKVEGNRNNTLPPIAQVIRQRSKKHLNELLQSLFNNTDDALFELADRSQSDRQQEMYFDSMRLVRLHRKRIASAFLQGFYDSFSQSFSAIPDEEPDDDGEEPEYELLGQDELEMSVAVSGIVSKVTSQYSLAVMRLTKRLDFLAKTQTITERTNPLGPQALSSTFAEALGTLEVNIKIRIILMKLFERFVMERLGPFYEDANRALIDADVLPDLKQRGKGRQTRVPVSPTDKSSQMATTPSGTILKDVAGTSAGVGFNTVQELLADIRDPRSRGGGVTGYGNAGSGDVIVLPSLESRELIQALSHLQTAESVDRVDIEKVPELGDVRSMILAQRGAEEKSLGQADDDTINFVGMLFDYILNDRNLAIPMKALISRLQIPIVKLAIIDKSFFERSAHPARALLNELSSAGIGWSNAQELKRDNLYNKIESVVIRVLDEFGDNPDVFAELLKELRAFVSKDSRRSVLVEQRVRESEVGKARTHNAKLQVQTLVNHKACGLRLPSDAGRFISEVWSRVLTLRMVKYGESSDAWNAGVATLDNLLWSLQPLSILADVEQRDKIAPELLQDIHEGMTELGCPLNEVEVFQSWFSEHLESLSENDRAYLEDDERPQLNIEEELIKEIILAAPPSPDKQTINPATAEKLKLITEGTWVEIQNDPERKLRCKLSTITQPGNNYIFVNRRGMKVLEKNRGQLAEMFETKALKLIDESQVFDRALQSVISNLRQMQRERVR